MTRPMSEGEVESTCSTPYVSAPSSPGRGTPPPAFFFSAPASPVHYILSSSPPTSAFAPSAADFSADFEFSARFSHDFAAAASAAASMTSADELFLNGQIRPMKLSSHLQRPQNLTPLLDLEEEDGNEGEWVENGGGDGAAAVAGEKSEAMSSRGREVRMWSKSMQRRARSMSPLRNWRNRDVGGRDRRPSPEPDESEAAATTPADDPPSDVSTPSVSESSSSSNSTSSRSSKRWVFLMDFLHRSKSEGRGRSSASCGKDKIWFSISFSPIDKEKKQSPSVSTPSSPNRKPKQRLANAGAPAVKRRIPPSPHELHYTANRAQAEELRKKTYLPYRRGLLGCLGFRSRSYVAMNGLTRALNPVSSR